MADALIAGVGMTPFVKPGQQRPYREMAAEAIQLALRDAGLESSDIQQAYAGHIFGGTGSGQHALYDAMQTGIPVFNVTNACCSGSSALMLARQAVQSGAIDCVLAFGFEEMNPGAITSDEWRESAGLRIEEVIDAFDHPRAALTPRWFGAAGQHYLDTYDARPELFAEVAVKTRRHARDNDKAIFREPITVDEVMNSPIIFGEYMTRLMACPPSCGAAAALLVSPEFAQRSGLRRTVPILGQVMATDTEASWQDPLNAVGYEMVPRASRQAYEQASVGPEDIDVIELHDCFTPNEVLTYEGLGLCGPGEATRLVADGDNSYGGRWVVNPSGGLMSKGHPIGATGLAQCTELVTQLRGEAGSRQVEGARIALQHNIGLVAGVTITIYGQA